MKKSFLCEEVPPKNGMYLQVSDNRIVLLYYENGIPTKQCVLKDDAGNDFPVENLYDNGEKKDDE